MVPPSPLHPVVLEPLPAAPQHRRPRRPPRLALLLVLPLAALAGLGLSVARPALLDAVQPFAPAFAAQALPAGSSLSASPPGGVPFDVCLNLPAWQPPDADVQGAHLASMPRFRDMDPAGLTAERVHIESGPFRSASAFADFIDLSGLWQANVWQQTSCSGNLQGRLELWGLGLQFASVDLDGPDLTVRTRTKATGVESVQLAVPAGAAALHVVDQNGSKLAPDLPISQS